jgi:serine/threonine-protein kinase
MWPVLVADLADGAARDFLEGIALAGGKLFVPLNAPPENGAVHVLEIHVPGMEPLIVLAEPAGAPTPVGYPLRLRPYDPNAVPRPRDSVPNSAPEVRAPLAQAAFLEAEPHGRGLTKHTLSSHHTQELSDEHVPHTPESLVGRTLAGGKLRIDSVIGAGGVGSVYRAFHRELRIPLAVKVLHEHFQSDIDFCRRFHAEALAASRLDHKNLMRVLDFGQEPDGLLYLAMEHLDGKCLGETLEAGKPQPFARTLDIMVQVCAGLAHAHARGIVHRDIKPDNIVVIASRDDDDAPIELIKVCDFGIAVQQSDRPSSVIVGTPDYMSPEQCAGAEQLDGRSDVYTCGVVLYELATGQLPFTAPTPMGLLNRHMHRPPPSPRTVCFEVSPELEAVILKALAKHPADRQQSMRELRNELRSLDPTSTAATPRAALVKLPKSIDTAPNSVDTTPDWLEHRGGYVMAARDLPAASIPAEALASELAARAAPWLARLAAVNRVDVFAELVAQLGLAIPVLVERKNVRTLLAVRSTIDVLAFDDRMQPPWRVHAARSLQHAFEDPAFLAMLAERALSGDAAPREVMELLLRAGTASPYALYSMRLRLTSHAGVNKRFVEAVRRFGIDALPMIRAGLTKLENRCELAVAASLATDLFSASPRVRDDVAGGLGARYVQAGSTASLTRAAADALTAFWGERAAPILLGLLNAEDELVLVSALDGLRLLRAIDEHVAVKVTAIARTNTSPVVVAAARAALATAAPPAVQITSQMRKFEGRRE